MKQELIKKIENIITQVNVDEDLVVFQLQELLRENELEKIVLKESKSLSNLYAAKMSNIRKPDWKDGQIKSGFTELDKLLGGFTPGELVVVGGRPSMGKTMLLVNLSLHISKQVPVIFYSYELSEDLLATRFISILSQIPPDSIARRKLENYEIEALSSIEKKIKSHKIYINDCVSKSITSLKAQCQKQIEEYGAKVIVIDYLQMMSHPRFRSHREYEISYIIREIKNIARDYNVCVIVSSQLSREVEKRPGPKRPILSDLRDSGSIEQEADKVIFVYRPEYYCITEDEMGNSTSGLMELIVAKNRSGYDGDVFLKLNRSSMVLEDFSGFTEDFQFFKERLDEIDEPPF